MQTQPEYIEIPQDIIEFFAHCYVRSLNWDESLAEKLLPMFYVNWRIHNTMRFQFFGCIHSKQDQYNQPATYGEMQSLLIELSCLTIFYNEHIIYNCLDNLFKNAPDRNRAKDEISELIKKFCQSPGQLREVDYYYSRFIYELGDAPIKTYVVAEPDNLDCIF